MGATFHRALGIEAVGTVEAAPDGGYAEYTSVPLSQVIPVDTGLPWEALGALPDTLRTVRVHGTACLGGSLSDQWTVRDFSPNEYLPKGVRLSGYSGDASDLPREALREILGAVEAGRPAFPVDRVRDGLEQVARAHDDMEHDRATGTLVHRVRHRA
ncbi:zinc-binding dehydrogenase [Streptomyces sp. NPDC007084]|uniref:zinc-binding dehydrogenase n=1 Tax=Streptomyces sp. NPDC007084 TaxID=3154313 RepID=UPI0034529E5F